MRTENSYFTVEPFDGINDKERPREGDVVDVEGRKARIDRSDWVRSDVFVCNSAKPDKKGSDAVVFLDHSIRRIVWRVWITYLKDDDDISGLQPS